MKRLTWIAIALFLIASCVQQQKEEIVKDAQLELVRNYIESAMAEHVEAGINNDAIAAVSVFDDEATIIEYGSPAIVGRKAIESKEVEQFEYFKILNSKHTIEGLTIQGEYAYQLGIVNGIF